MSTEQITERLLVSLLADLQKSIHSDAADKFRDEATRHVVDQPYADNRYVRLLDDLRRILARYAPDTTTNEPVEPDPFTDNDSDDQEQP